MSRLTPDPYQERIRSTVAGEVIGLAAPSTAASFTRAFSVTWVPVAPPYYIPAIQTTFEAPTHTTTVLSTMGNLTPTWSRTIDVFETDSYYPTITCSWASAYDFQSEVAPTTQTPMSSVTRSATVTVA